MVALNVALSIGCVPGFSFSSEENQELLLLSDGDLGVWVWGRARIDNRLVLARELGLPEGHRSIGQVIAGAFLKWGDEAPNRLVGDFALVVGARKFGVKAARDPFGVEPLFFRRRSETKVSFAFRPEVLREPMEPIRQGAVQDFLAWRFSADGQSFFQDIESLRPGLSLSLLPGTLTTRRYYRPPKTLSDPMRVQDVEDEFGRLFRQAVARRIDPHRPTAARLSGGLDSSSIVGVASRLLATKKQKLIPIAATFPGTEYDETSYISQIEAFSGIPAVKVNGTVWRADDLTAPSPSWPGGRSPFYGGRTEIEIAKAEGCRYILCGQRGDSLVQDQTLVNDYFECGAWFHLLRRLATDNRSQLKRDLRSIGGIVAKRWRLSSRPKNVSEKLSKPWWLRAPKGADFLSDAESEDYDGALPCTLQRAVWGEMTEASGSWVLERLQLYANEEGLSFRFPYLDRDLVDFVMSVPWASRGSHPANRWLQRSGLRRWLPKGIAERGKVTFNLAAVDRTRALLPYIETMLSGRTWLSEPFVAQVDARRELNRLRLLPRKEELWRPWLALYRIGCLEAWLRALPGVH